LTKRHETLPDHGASSLQSVRLRLFSFYQILCSSIRVPRSTLTVRSSTRSITPHAPRLDATAAVCADSLFSLVACVCLVPRSVQIVGASGVALGSAATATTTYYSTVTISRSKAPRNSSKVTPARFSPPRRRRVVRHDAQVPYKPRRTITNNHGTCTKSLRPDAANHSSSNSSCCA
jgi:hypothetical protein